MNSKSQASIEYLVIIGFVSFAVLGIIFVAYLYTGSAKDKIRDNEIEVFANKIISSAEAVFYSGEPSQTTILIYVPEDINDISVEGENQLIVDSSSYGGGNVRGFNSNVNLKLVESGGSGDMTPDEKARFVTKGTKKLKLKATTDEVEISLSLAP